mgnify:CR=1 FL=1
MQITAQAPRFTLSYALIDDVLTFDSEAAAGRAFAEADPAQRPSVIRAENGSARTIARTVLIDARAAKSAPRLDALAAAPASPDLAFWTAYHAASETLLAA